MKFDCGETKAELLARKSQWHLWFAWRPVKVSDHDCRWLEWVERRGFRVLGYDGGLWWDYEYRPIQS